MARNDDGGYLQVPQQAEFYILLSRNMCKALSASKAYGFWVHVFQFVEKIRNDRQPTALLKFHCVLEA